MDGLIHRAEVEVLMCGCGDVGLFIAIWHVRVASGPTTRPGDYIIMHRRFIIPCAQCSYEAHLRWFAKHNEELDSIAPHVVGQETAVAS